MLSNISAEWEIIDGLVAKTTGGAELGYEYNNNYIPKYKWGNKSRPIPRNHCLRLMKSCICGIIHLLMTRYSANIN